MGLLGPDGECPGACKCPDGTQWHVDKELCVPDSEYSIIMCPANSSWNSCASPCERTCSDPDADSAPCIEVCEERCDCHDGFVRDEDSGECVKDLGPKFRIR